MQTVKFEKVLLVKQTLNAVCIHYEFNSLSNKTNCPDRHISAWIPKSLVTIEEKRLESNFIYTKGKPESRYGWWAKVTVPREWAVKNVKTLNDFRFKKPDAETILKTDFKSMVKGVPLILFVGYSTGRGYWDFRDPNRFVVLQDPEVIKETEKAICLSANIYLGRNSSKENMLITHALSDSRVLINGENFWTVGEKRNFQFWMPKKVLAEAKERATKRGVKYFHLPASFKLDLETIAKFAGTII